MTKLTEPIWRPYEPDEMCWPNLWSADHWHKQGIRVLNVESYDQLGERIKFLGFGDLIVQIPNRPLIIRATDGSDGSWRKITHEYRTDALWWLADVGGEIEVWQWRVLQANHTMPKRWHLRILPVTLDDLANADVQTIYEGAEG